MNSSEKVKFFLFIIYSLFFLLITTDYLTLNNLIYDANQTDLLSYTAISKEAPFLPKDNNIIIQHVAQRFLIPYIIGIFAKFLNIELFLSYKIFTFFFILSLIFLIFFIVKKLNLNLYEGILFFSLFFFNPYIIRYHLFNPVQVHDLIFFLSGFLFSYGIIKNYKKFYYTSSLFSLLIRQTGIAMVAATLIKIFIYKNFKFRNFFIYILIFVLIMIFITKIGNHISIHSFSFNYAFGIVNYDFTQIDKLFRFLILPLVSFFPLLIIFFGKTSYEINKITVFTLLTACLLMIGQPIAAGPNFSGRNIVRVATLCYPILICLVFYIYKFENFCKKKILYISFIIGLQIWSLHPTFSKFKLFSILRI